MNRNAFWALIDQARSEADSVFDVAPALIGLLLDLEPDETVSFARHIKDLLAESYRWDLWAVAYIVNGGSADDGFEYFRGWLIAQGRERFQAALENPASIGDYAEPDENECEDILYVAQEAYQSKTGEEFPYESVDSSPPSEPAGQRWDEEDLERLYPELCERFL